MFVIYVTDPNKINEKHKPDYEFIGAAVSESTNNPGPQPDGYAVKDTPKAKGQIWDSNQLIYVDPPAKTLYSYDGFMALFTEDERKAYYEATALADPFRRYMQDFLFGSAIDRTSTLTGKMLDHLVLAGVITAKRKGEINT